jgi:hypothetical protein
MWKDELFTARPGAKIKLMAEEKSFFRKIIDWFIDLIKSLLARKK